MVNNFLLERLSNFLLRRVTIPAVVDAADKVTLHSLAVHPGVPDKRNRSVGCLVCRRVSRINVSTGRGSLPQFMDCSHANRSMSSMCDHHTPRQVLPLAHLQELLQSYRQDLIQHLSLHASLVQSKMESVTCRLRLLVRS